MVGQIGPPTVAYSVRVSDRLVKLLVVGAIVFLVSHRAGMSPWGLVGLAGWFLAIRPVETSRHATGPALIPVLIGTAKLHAVTGALIALGLVLATTVS